MEADQLMTLTAKKYKNMMIENQAPKVMQHKNPQKKKEGQSTKPQRPKWLSNNEKPHKGQLTRIRVWNGNKWSWCSKETGGKCEGRWVRHPPASCEGKAFKGFNKKGTPKDAPKQEKFEKKSKRKEETDDGKERKCNRLTAAFATTYNEANNSSDNEK